MDQPTRYTLFELNEYVRRIMALNFPDALWISCELAQVNESRGHYYLSLVQKEEPETLFAEDKILAQSEAVIWAMDYRKLKRKLGSQFSQVLKPGLEILIHAKVEFHERYGLKLRVMDIDPAFTVGKLEMKKQETLKQLKQKGLLDKNKELELPKVLQNIAVISSERAAGYQDFHQQLIGNPYGYKIGFQLFTAAMQGDQVSREVVSRLKMINDQSDFFDCVVIIRGGGAKLDLHAFDDAELCTAIANCKVPVITGIGHDIDETIADLVAYQALKTPTAVAEWLVQQNLYFEMEVLEQGRSIKDLVQIILSENQFELESLSQALQLIAKGQIQNQDRLLNYIEEELPRNARSPIKNEDKSLEHLEAVLKLLNPEEVLKRGFSMTLKDGKPVKEASELKAEDVIESVFAKGKIKSRVIKK